MERQRASHARAKRRIKVLKMKNFCKRVIDGRLSKIAKLKRPKGRTIMGKASDVILFVTTMQKRFYQKMPINQRQKRKLWRQAPHSRKAA